jgi:phage terminase large subunit
MGALDFFNFREPDYVRVYELRAERLNSIRSQPEILSGLKEYYRDHPVDFINDWLMTFDPRNAEIKKPTVIPMVLFAKQAEFVEWVVARWRNREDGLAEKSRDMGVSWLCVHIAVWMWLFHPGTVIGFGSRKEEYVDKMGDPKSLFWKIRKAIDLLPEEFQPIGYQENRHALSMRIMNPENGSTIVGEAGDNIGRGNRTSIYFKDESAFYDRADAIEAALSQTSNCKIDVSTVNGNGNPFYRKRHSGKVPVFTFHWKDDPRKDAAWYAKQQSTLDPVIVAQEIDIDYNASVADSFISGALVSAAQNNGPANIEAIGKWRIAIDAAHFGDDESVIHCRKGRLNLPQICRRRLDGPQLASLVEATCDDRVAGGDEIEAIVIELDGPGVSCFDQLKLGRYKQYVQGIHTGAKLSDNKNYNVRARMWRAALEYLEDAPVSMHNDGEVRSQLASVRYKYKDGLLIMQSKKEYKAIFGKSPDRADAFVLAHAPVKPVRATRTAEPTGYGPTAGGWMGS